MKKILGIIVLGVLLVFATSSLSTENTVDDVFDVEVANANDLAPHAIKCKDGGIKIVCYGQGDGCSPTVCIPIINPN